MQSQNSHTFNTPTSIHPSHLLLTHKSLSYSPIHPHVAFFSLCPLKKAASAVTCCYTPSSRRQIDKRSAAASSAAIHLLARFTTPRAVTAIRHRKSARAVYSGTRTFDLHNIHPVYIRWTAAAATLRPERRFLTIFVPGARRYAARNSVYVYVCGGGADVRI